MDSDRLFCVIPFVGVLAKCASNYQHRESNTVAPAWHLAQSEVFQAQ